MRTPFLGSAYTSRSANLAGQRLINLYPELVETKSGKAVAAFYGAPGLDLRVTCGAGPIRGQIATPTSDIVVSGREVYSVSTSYIATLLGTLATSTGPVTIISNGLQQAIFDGIKGYLIDSGALTVIPLPFSGPVIATYQDGFGLVNQVGTIKWWQSNLFDLSTWDALDFTTADSKPDFIIGVGNIHRENWLMKAQHTEVWINAGLPGFAFERIDGVFFEVGCQAPYSIANAGEHLLWLAQSNRGESTVYMSSGYQVDKVSTHAIDRQIATYAHPEKATAYSYQQEGHTFYVINFAEASWCFDLTNFKAAGPSFAWSQRGAWNNGNFERHWADNFAAFNNELIVGDYRNGNLYALDLDTLTDNGSPKKWLRSWRAFDKPPDEQFTFPALQIDMETGITVPSGADPQCMLRWSDDGGHTWSNERYQSVGKIGETAARVKFNRLGSTRKQSGLDRYFELSSDDPFYPALIGAVLEE